MRSRFPPTHPDTLSALRSVQIERTSLLEEVPPPLLSLKPSMNKRLSKLIRNLVIDQSMGFQGLLRIDSMKVVDKIMCDRSDKFSSASSQVSSSGSCGYLQPRFPVEDITAKYHSELRSQLKSKSLFRLHSHSQAECQLFRYRRK